jgi:hypothetical protein
MYMPISAVDHREEERQIIERRYNGIATVQMGFYFRTA